MEPDIKNKHAEQFVADLWNHIKETGFGSQTKNDFYDFVLYLFNKHDEDRHFLSVNSPYENSQLLKVTTLKLTTSSENIFLKYYSDKEKSEIPLKFLACVTTGKTVTETDGENVVFMVDDKRVRAYLGGILKKEQGTTFDVRLNSEKIVLNSAVFFTLCRDVIADFCAKTGVDMSKAEKDIAAKEQGENRKKRIQAFFKGAAAVGGIFKFPVQEIIEVCSAAKTYFANL